MVPGLRRIRTWALYRPPGTSTDCSLYYPVRPARPVPARRTRARTRYELLARWGPNRRRWGTASEAALLSHSPNGTQKRRSRDQHVPVWCIQLEVHTALCESESRGALKTIKTSRSAAYLDAGRRRTLSLASRIRKMVTVKRKSPMLTHYERELYRRNGCVR